MLVPCIVRYKEDEQTLVHVIQDSFQMESNSQQWTLRVKAEFEFDVISIPCQALRASSTWQIRYIVAIKIRRRG